MESGELDPGRFAADDRFVRAILHRIVADPNQVDDLAQETWLAVLRQAATGGFLGRAWLSTVARNCALQTLRGDERRRIRESIAGEASGVDAEGNARCDPETRARVLRSVDGLPETYREVVRLRFFDDLGPGAIAERLGLPVETVRTRLKRGLSRLQRELQRRRA